jgi:hyaluronoglucosaminidase
VADVSAFAAATGRPPVIWDNYPVNDLLMMPDLHLGPLVGRAAALHEQTRGFVANLMSQPVASQIALQTVGEYLSAPNSYDPAAAWERALSAAAGPAGYEALRGFAENSLSSALHPAPPEPLATLTTAALVSLKLGEPALASSAVQALDDYLAGLQAASRYLSEELVNEPLRAELRPWLELLDTWLALGREALHLLRAGQGGQSEAGSRQLLGELRTMATGHRCRITGNALLPLLDYALQFPATSGVATPIEPVAPAGLPAQEAAPNPLKSS